MKKFLFAIAFTLVCAGAAAAQTTGSVSVSASSSDYVDIAIGGSAAGSDGAVVISGDQGSGEALSLTVNMGEINPSRNAAYASVEVPLRLRSNSAYTLTLQATDTANTGDQILLSDFGFGLSTTDRTDPNVKSGTDTHAANVEGDPTEEQDAGAGGRWAWESGRALSGYVSSAATVLSGPTINEVSPAADEGLRVSAHVAVVPQFFAESSFSTTLTFTIAAQP